MPVIPVAGRLKQDKQEVQASLGYSYVLNTIMKTNKQTNKEQQKKSSIESSQAQKTQLY